MNRYDKGKRKKKNISLKASSLSINDETKKEKDEKIVMLTRKFRKFMNRMRGVRRNFKKIKDNLNEGKGVEYSKRMPIIYYEGKKPKHIRINCL